MYLSLKKGVQFGLMEPFSSHTGRLAILPNADIDTDQIIPARFLSMITKSGYGELLFKDIRGENFPLDAEASKGATILLTGENFGCGSSREHAVWAIQQAGFKAVIAKRSETAGGFSDIFRMNSANNGLLLIELETENHSALQALGNGAQITIDLPAQTINFGGDVIKFEIAPATKDALLRGLDLIGTTLVHEPAINAYEQERGPWTPPSRI